MPDLLAAVLILEPDVPATVPAALGRHVHGWLLDRIGQADGALAQQLHESDGPRPFTVSNLWGAGRADEGYRALEPGRTCWLRVTGLTREVSAAIGRALPEPGERVTVAGAALPLARVATSVDDHPWAGGADYGQLVQHYTLAQGGRPRAVRLRFSSPTLFRRQGRDLPLPLPELVFDGYLRKWNTFAPLALPEEAKRYAQECVALSKYRLRSRFISFEGSGKGGHVGFTGEARFRFLTGDAYWTRVMSLLAGYAFWCGTGYRTTVGFGQTQALRGSPVDSVGT